MTTRRSRSSGTGRGAPAGFPLVILAVAVVMLSGSVPLPAQVEEDLAGSLDQYRNILTLGREALQNLELAEAITFFGEVIDAHRTGRLPVTSPMSRQMVGQAWEGRGLAYANLGRTEEAERDFEALIRYDTGWPLDRERHSPKIVAIFDKVRARVIGTIALDSNPAGAEILLNGETLGRTPLFDRELADGTYEMELRLNGFDVVREQITVTGGSRLERTFPLAANARGILVATVPPGVSVTVDGSERGATFGAAGSDYLEAAERMGIPLTSISAPLLVDNLPPGQHLLKLEKECHVTQLLSVNVDLDPNDITPQRYEPMVLSASLGSISISSTPPEAGVHLDGKLVGRTPLKVAEVCSGRHQIRLSRDGVGQWIGHVDVDRDRREEVSERLRMTLLSIGVSAPGARSESTPESAELMEMLSRLDEFAVLGPESLPEGLRSTVMTKGREGGLPDEMIVRVAQATGADLVIGATLAGSAFERRLDMTLQSARYPALVDRVSISLDDADQVEKFIHRLDEQSRLGRPWIGVDLIETHRSVNPIVIRVRPSSPAEAGGVKVGDRLVEVGGQPLKIPSDLDRILEDLSEGSNASLTLQSPGQVPRQVNVIIGVTPIIRPSESPGHLGSLFAAEMAFRARMEAASGRESSRARNAALLNLAVALMRMGLCQPALREGLEVARLPAGPGVSAGTVHYLEGLCLERLNRPADARRRFEEALGQADATLWTHDGPPVAERARRRLAGLGAS